MGHFAKFSLFFPLKKKSSKTSLSRSWTVSVMQPPRIVSQLPRLLPVLEGGSVRMTCAAEGIPSPETRWLGGEGGGPQLALDRVGTEVNGTELVCRASNEHGSQERAVKIIVVR